MTIESLRMPGRLIEFCEQARARIAAAERILLAAHVFPEPDAIGSEAALARHLLQQGRQVFVCNPSPVLDVYRFLTDLSGLPPEHWVEGSDRVPEHDLIILLDVSDWDYMASLGKVLRRSPAPKILFDHHQSSAPAGTLALIDPDASATGEVLFRYFLATGAPVDREMAQALYASILFDTGSFRFRNARDETLLIAAELIRQGASHRETVAKLFENESFPRVELLTAALARLVSDADGRIAWTYVTEEMFRRTGTTAGDADGIIDHLMTIRGVQIGVLFRELPGGGVKVTFRSKGKPNVGRLAGALGGGGRPTAAGVTLPGSLREASNRVVPAVRSLVGTAVRPVEECDVSDS
ncbi:MAG: DHH family phosphoesterase [Candidatus Eisenbacteria sp.]|nr:DHH family phosphoesterase [Candidatus Eisenbacteria bacterium]